MIKKIGFLFSALLLIGLGCNEMVNKSNPGKMKLKGVKVSVVNTPSTKTRSANYISNRAPLRVNSMIKLPVGSIQPKGWLGVYLDRQRKGLTGNLGKISAWLQKKDNAWLSKNGKGKWGWEEVPYWLKGYGNIGYILNDAAMIKETKIWVNSVLESQRPNGNFGPKRRFGNDGSQDFWANMVMLHCLQSYYEKFQDKRVLDLMTKYFKYQLTVPDKKFLTHYWQRMRGGDNIYSVIWLYNRTGDKFLLDLIRKLDRNTANWRMKNDLPNWHNVNIAQGFREPAQFYQLSKNPAHLQATYNNFEKIRRHFGQMPGGMWAGDENSRWGYDDPRQGVETCGLVEHMFSDEILTRITGDSFWADNCEDIAFNTFPASVMPDFKSLRYITSPNMVQSDQANHHPGIDNKGPFLMMNPFSSRCCQHNHSHGWAYYSESLWLATQDNGLTASLYAPCVVTAKVADGKTVTITEDTRYPFRETVKFSLKMKQSVRFPLYFRIPKWCKGATFEINGQPVKVQATPGKYVRIERTWNNEDKITLKLPMTLRLKTWKKNHNSVSVSYGPLTYSLKIKENYIKRNSAKTAIGDSRWQKGADVKNWPSWEIYPASPWNYGLVLKSKNINDNFKVVLKPWPKDNFPFEANAAPIEIRAVGKRIDQWKLDRHKLCGILQDSPVKSSNPEESITLIPMGAARLRISAFPVIGDGPNAKAWK